MNVGDLIKKLQTLPADAMVVVEAEGDFTGFEELETDPALVALQLDPKAARCEAKGKFYMGSKYEEAEGGPIAAVCIA